MKYPVLIAVSYALCCAREASVNDLANQPLLRSEREYFNLDDTREEYLIDLDEGLHILNEGFHDEASDDESGVPIFPFEFNNNNTEVSGPLSVSGLIEMVNSADPVIRDIVYHNGDEISEISGDDMGYMNLDWEMDDPTIEDSLIL